MAEATTDQVIALQEREDAIRERIGVLREILEVRLVSWCEKSYRLSRVNLRLRCSSLGLRFMRYTAYQRTTEEALMRRR